MHAYTSELQLVEATQGAIRAVAARPAPNINSVIRAQLQHLAEITHFSSESFRTFLRRHLCLGNFNRGHAAKSRHVDDSWPLTFEFLAKRLKKAEDVLGCKQPPKEAKTPVKLSKSIFVVLSFKAAPLMRTAPVFAADVSSGLVCSGSVLCRAEGLALAPGLGGTRLV